MTHWQDGTPRSTNNAFSILLQTRPDPDSAKPPSKRGPKFATGESPQAKALRRVLRVNRDTYVPTTQADRDRNAAIAGRGVISYKDY